MSLLSKGRLILLLWAIATCITGSLAADQDILAEQARVTENPFVKESFKKSFENLSRTKGRGPDTTAWAECGGCDQAPDCCIMGGWANFKARPTNTRALRDRLILPTTTATTTHSVNCARDCPSTSIPAPPGSTSWLKQALPTTFLNSKPLRSTIYRDPPKAQAPEEATETFANIPPEASIAAIHEITETYYDFTLEGRHPFVVPLVIENGDKDPLSLLATASLLTPFSFISLSLLEDLGLSKNIKDTRKTDISDAELSRLLTFDTRSRGAILLDVLAGKNDRQMINSRFIVFEPTSRPEGPLLPDITVGLNFLNKANALRLSDEYVGIGVKDGLGVLVQRAFGPERLGPGEEEAGDLGHDEL